jgi:hypothetical protein
MEVYLYLSALILFVIFIFYRVYVLYYGSSRIKIVDQKLPSFMEGFESFKNCLSQGYPKDFCMRSPIQACVTNCPVGKFVEKKFNTFK